MDPLGLIIAVVVTAASVTDTAMRDYESRPESSVSRTLWASAANLVRRLTGTSTPSWRDPV